MNASLLWIALPALPLAAIPLLVWRRERTIAWLWLTAIPGLYLALRPPDSILLELLWPAAQWGGGDLVTRGWLAFSAAIWTCGALYTAATEQSFRFWLFWQLALSGNLLLCIAQDGLSFYAGFSAMSLSAYGLIVHHNGSWRRRAGRLYVQMALAAEMLVFAGLALQANSVRGMISFGEWQYLPLNGTSLALLFSGFAIKAGLWPLHSWMPLAYPAPPPGAAAVFAGAMTSAGILGIWRFLPAGEAVVQSGSALMFGLGLVSIFFGVLMGLASHRALVVLAYSSISQMGYLLVIMTLAWHDPGHLPGTAQLLLLFAIHHGVAKAALFLGAGVAARRRLPAGFWLLIALPALAIAGLPLTSGGAVKAALEHQLGDSAFAAFSLLFKLAAAGTALLLIRALWLIRRANRRKFGWQDPRRPGWRVSVSWGLLSLAPLVLPWAWPLFREMLRESLSWSTTWDLLWPMGVAALLTAAAVMMGLRVPPRWPDRRNPILRLSFLLKQLLHNPPVPKHRPQPDWNYWRQRERRWNQFWNRRGVVAASTWLLCLLLLFGVFWSVSI